MGVSWLCCSLLLSLGRVTAGLRPVGRAAAEGCCSLCRTSPGPHVPQAPGQGGRRRGSGETPVPQVQLRRCLHLRLAGQCSLTQWGGGSSLECGDLQGRVLLQGEEVQVVVRGPGEGSKAAFFFLEEILGIIDQVACYTCLSM